MAKQCTDLDQLIVYLNVFQHQLRDRALGSHQVVLQKVRVEQLELELS